MTINFITTIPSKDVDSVQASDLSNERVAILLNSEQPVILRKAALHWPGCQFYKELTESHRLNVTTSFRIHPLTAGTVREVDCSLVHDVSLHQFKSWEIQEDVNLSNPLKSFDRRNYCLYADYKYFEDLFGDASDAAATLLNWPSLGCNTSDQPTFWLGSDGCHTPLHFDTYGRNLVVQLSGVKHWTIFPPSATKSLYPTRIPYEESSVYSKVDLLRWESDKYPDVSDLFQYHYKAILHPGDVLFLPMHWWHFVQCTTTALSVNMWLDSHDDNKERCKEAIVRFLVENMRDSISSNIPYNWQCSSNEEWSSEIALQTLRNTIALSGEAGADRFSFRSLVDVLLSPDMIDLFYKKLICEHE